MEPLEQAKAIQNESRGNSSSRNRDDPRRANHKRPLPLSHSAFSQLPSGSPEELHQHGNRGPRKRRRKRPQPAKEISTAGKTDKTNGIPKRSSTHSTTLVLCTSGSENGTDDDSNEGGRLHSESARTDKFRRTVQERKRRQPIKPPSYPSTHLPESSPTQGQNNDEKYSNTTRDDTSSFVGNGHGGGDNGKLKRKKSVIGLDSGSEWALNGTDEQKSKNKREMIAESFMSTTEQRIPKKKSFRKENSFSIEVPVLKPAFTSKRAKKRKEKYYHDVKDMSDDFDRVSDENDHGKADTSWIDGMKKVMEAAESCRYDIDKEKGRNIISISETTKNTSNTTSASIASSSTMSRSPQISIKKVNQRGLRPKTKSRKASKIVPGSTFTQKDTRQQQPEKEFRWRSVKDKDEYHIPKKKTRGTIICHGAFAEPLSVTIVVLKLCVISGYSLFVT
jgi:hypothetical protein